MMTMQSSESDLRYTGFTVMGRSKLDFRQAIVALRVVVGNTQGRGLRVGVGGPTVNKLLVKKLFRCGQKVASRRKRRGVGIGLGTPAGKFAAVRKCTHKVTAVEYAAKFIRKRRRAMDQRQDILHEVAVLQLVTSSARIVRLHEVYETGTEMALVLEMAVGGELQRILDREEALEEQQAVRVMRQILEGLNFLHDKNIAHLDLKSLVHPLKTWSQAAVGLGGGTGYRGRKIPGVDHLEGGQPQNLLLTGVYPDCDIKLCDFGISRVIQSGAEVREILGTPDYVAPEILSYEPISLATDIWSVGVLAYVLVSGYSPFAGDTKQETFCNISRCCLTFPEELFEGVSDRAKDFIRATLVTKPSSLRLTTQQCLSHPWLSDNVLNMDSPVTLTTLTSQPDERINRRDSSDSCSKSDVPRCNGTTTVETGLVTEQPQVSHETHKVEISEEECLLDSEVSEINNTPKHTVHYCDSAETNHCLEAEDADDLPVHKRPKNSPGGRRSSFPIGSCLCCCPKQPPLSPEFLKGCQHRHYSSPTVSLILDRGVIY
uniref:non-specific serine/threonine protein kinase n=1 Tax=Timema shepardi TaxID=629360 RepID=A0A7R9G432_TIMSH|nr:unnamed protein product [Timema shepardi]